MSTIVRVNLSGSFSFEFSPSLDSHSIEGIQQDYEDFLKRCAMYVASGDNAEIGNFRIRVVTDNDFNFNTNKMKLK